MNLTGLHAIDKTFGKIGIIIKEKDSSVMVQNLTTLETIWHDISNVLIGEFKPKIFEVPKLIEVKKEIKRGKKK